MTHLGERVSALVDGRLSPDATERALVHVAECPACQAELTAERVTRRRLSEAPDPQPSPELVGSLLAMGGPAGPLAPWPGHAPGAARPVPLPPPGYPWDSRRPDGRSDATGPGRGRRRLRSAAVGVLSVASLSLIGLLLLGTAAGRPAPEAIAFGPAALTPEAQPVGTWSASAERLDAEELERLRAEGWPCPLDLGNDLALVDARSMHVDGAPVLHLVYSDGSSTVSVVEQRGRLAAAQAAAFSEALGAGARLSGREVPWHGVWQSGDVVVAVVADGPPEVASQVVEALPRGGVEQHGWWDRVGRGADVVGALLSRG